MRFYPFFLLWTIDINHKRDCNDIFLNELKKWCFKFRATRHFITEKVHFSLSTNFFFLWGVEVEFKGLKPAKSENLQLFGVRSSREFPGTFYAAPRNMERWGFGVRNAMKSWFLPVRSFLFLSNYCWAWPFRSFLCCETGQRVGVRTEGKGVFCIYLFIYCPLWISWAQEAVYCKKTNCQRKVMLVSWCYEVSWHRVKTLAEPDEMKRCTHTFLCIEIAQMFLKYYHLLFEV